MGLALTKEYQEQLSLVQKEIGFSHIRGHGLFCDDIGIYQETPEGESEYNFTYLDRVMDSYISLGLRPFLELGFMPQKMASGTQTIFYWKYGMSQICQDSGKMQICLSISNCFIQHLMQ